MAKRRQQHWIPERVQCILHYSITSLRIFVIVFTLDISTREVSCSQPEHQERPADNMRRERQLHQFEHNTNCTIYLAPSTIPNAGLGIFTTIPRRRGEFIGHGDVFLPLFEMDWHNELMIKYKEDPSFNYFNPFSDYAWTGESMGMGLEVQSTDVQAMCPGLDAAINCNLALINVGKALPVWDDAGLHRSRDPGAGALTLYHNGSSPVIYRDIPAGGELFKFYGDDWVEKRPHMFDLLPLSEDYPRAQRLLDSLGQLIGVGKQPSEAGQIRFTVQLQRDLWKLVFSIPFPSRTMNALPRKLEDAWVAIQDGLSALYQAYAIRSNAYLEQHGKCLDNIKPGRSTIPQAARGAFAVRPMKQGTVISGTPLLHLPRFHVFDMYDIYQNETSESSGNWKRGNVVKGYQLMLNYCFGHSQSTLLLCPYGAGILYMNHNQTLANVKVQWSQHGLTSHNDSWFHLTPLEMEWIYKPNLALDYVALRDIQEGEELFLDYGDEFEQAWQQHVTNWKPLLPNAKTYVSAHDFNAIMSDTPLRTEREQEYHPYPANLQIRCHSSILWLLLAKRNWTTQHIPKIDGTRNINLLWPVDEKGVACRILERMYDDEEYHVDVYKVQVLKEQKDDNATITKKEEETIAIVPRCAISFVDRPYTTDMHLPNAFRFPMMIPDDMFPDAWRNLSPQKSMS